VVVNQVEYWENRRGNLAGFVYPAAYYCSHDAAPNGSSGKANADVLFDAVLQVVVDPRRPRVARNIQQQPQWTLWSVSKMSRLRYSCGQVALPNRRLALETTSTRNEGKDMTMKMLTMMVIRRRGSSQVYLSN
jgi:hypothetical protein